MKKWFKIFFIILISVCVSVLIALIVNRYTHTLSKESVAISDESVEEGSKKDIYVFEFDEHHIKVSDSITSLLDTDTGMHIYY